MEQLNSDQIPDVSQGSAAETVGTNLFQEYDMLAVDGKRPIDPSDFEVEAILDIDGQRPISKSNFQVQDTLEIDGSRPIFSDNTVEEEIIRDYVD